MKVLFGFLFICCFILYFAKQNISAEERKCKIHIATNEEGKTELSIRSISVGNHIQSAHSLKLSYKKTNTYGIHTSINPNICWLFKLHFRAKFQVFRDVKTVVYSLINTYEVTFLKKVVPSSSVSSIPKSLFLIFRFWDAPSPLCYICNWGGFFLVKTQLTYDFFIHLCWRHVSVLTLGHIQVTRHKF